MESNRTQRKSSQLILDRRIEAALMDLVSGLPDIGRDGELSQAKERAIAVFKVVHSYIMDNFYPDHRRRSVRDLGSITIKELSES